VPEDTSGERAIIEAAQRVVDESRLVEQGGFGTYTAVPLPAMANLIAALGDLTRDKKR
jgi:hypothetical protein